MTPYYKTTSFTLYPSASLGKPTEAPTVVSKARTSSLLQDHASQEGSEPCQTLYLVLLWAAQAPWLFCPNSWISGCF